MSEEDAINFIKSALNKALVEWMDKPPSTAEAGARAVAGQYDSLLREHGGSASFESLKDGVITVSCKLPPTLAELWVEGWPLAHKTIEYLSLHQSPLFKVMGFLFAYSVQLLP